MIIQQSSSVRCKTEINVWNGVIKAVARGFTLDFTDSRPATINSLLRIGIIALAILCPTGIVFETPLVFGVELSKQFPLATHSSFDIPGKPPSTRFCGFPKSQWLLRTFGSDLMHQTTPGMVSSKQYPRDSHCNLLICGHPPSTRCCGLAKLQFGFRDLPVFSLKHQITLGVVSSKQLPSASHCCCVICG